jgi:RNA polymerase sigma-70 factor (ECF subfamily)
MTNSRVDIPGIRVGLHMEEMSNHDRLSRISTQWDLLFASQQHRSRSLEAQRRLLIRYGGAIYRYLLAAVRDPDAAEELSQEFALRFVRGDFHRAHPDRGRFRDFLKATLYHLIVDHHRRRHAALARLPSESRLADGTGAVDLCSEEFKEYWRAELLDRAWEALAAAQASDGKPWHTSLSWRVSHPTASSMELASELSRTLGRTISAENARQILHRARDRFADCLLQEVRRSLDSRSPDEIEHKPDAQGAQARAKHQRSLDSRSRDEIESEVIELGLLNYCRQALQRLPPGEV